MQCKFTLTPSTSPGGTFDEDELRRSPTSADRVNGSLHQAVDDRSIHVMRLVLEIENDMGIRGELLGKVLPPSRECIGVGDDAVVVTHEVVGVNDSIATLAGDVADNGFEALKVRRIESASEAVGRRADAFHEEGDTEGVEAQVHEVLARWYRQHTDLAS